MTNEKTETNDIDRDGESISLSRFERVQLARHQDRPFTLDYIRLLCTDWFELHGDRKYRDDPSIVGGWATLAGRSVMIIGHQKGRGMKENLKRNFGSPHPEGYRKAERLMHTRPGGSDCPQLDRDGRTPCSDRDHHHR